jgi:hypothetical protein
LNPAGPLYGSWSVTYIRGEERSLASSGHVLIAVAEVGFADAVASRAHGVQGASLATSAAAGLQAGVAIPPQARCKRISVPFAPNAAGPLRGSWSVTYLRGEEWGLATGGHVLIAVAEVGFADAVASRAHGVEGTGLAASTAACLQRG